jgi:hypothetical protein
MSGLFRRIRGRRTADADSHAPVAALSPGPEAPHEAPTAALPAGLDTSDPIGERPTTQRRSRLRRRLRHLRRVRELLLRDLGGYVYELHRTGAERDTPVLRDKLARLETLDTEEAELSERLQDRADGLVIREPGIGGTCETCGELFGSEARYCSNCGMPQVADAARPVPALNQGAETAATSFWGTKDEEPTAVHEEPAP